MMRWIRFFSGLILFWGAPALLMGQGLQVGVSRVDITPADPVELGGYASRQELSQGIHDRLYGRITLFDDGGSRLLIISVDSIGFYTGGYEYLIDGIIQETGFKREEVFLSAIHSHSAPRIGTDEELHANNREYTKWMRNRLIEAIREAVEKQGPARIGVGSGASPVGVNRRETKPTGEVTLGRNPMGIHDREVFVLRIEPASDRPPALLFSYATHATSLGARNLLVSGDLIGLAEQFVEEILGREVVSSAFAGASGDIDPWYRVLPGFHEEPGWIPETELLGKLLGTEVVRVYRSIDRFEETAAVETLWRTVSLPGKPRGERFQDEEAEAEDVELNLMVGRLGEIGIVGIGGEVLTEIGTRIKQGSPFRNTMIVTHCNGAAGYLPPRGVYKEGGYEVLTSPFAPEAADQVTREVLQMLHAIHGE